jgi:hypothetical protein
MFDDLIPLLFALPVFKHRSVITIVDTESMGAELLFPFHLQLALLLGFILSIFLLDLGSSLEVLFIVLQ